MQVRGALGAYLVDLPSEIGWRHMFSDAKRRPASDIRRDDYEQRGLFSAVLEVPVQPREGHEQREENGAKRAEKAKRLSPFEFALRGPLPTKAENALFFADHKINQISQPVWRSW